MNNIHNSGIKPLKEIKQIAVTENGAVGTLTESMCESPSEEVTCEPDPVTRKSRSQIIASARPLRRVWARPV